VTTRAPGGTEHVVERREVTFAKRLIGYNYSFFVVLIGLPLLWSRMPSELGRYSLWFLLTMFPYRIVMTDALSTRCLMFLPFVAIVAALVLGRRALLAVLSLLIALDVVFLVDPMTASGLPYMPEATIVERPLER